MITGNSYHYEKLFSTQQLDSRKIWSQVLKILALWHIFEESMETECSIFVDCKHMNNAKMHMGNIKQSETCGLSET